MSKRFLIKKILTRKEKRIKEIEEHRSDSSSIGDMAFLLLIFFIVTGSFMLREGISFTLPSKSGSTKINPQDIVELYPDNKGILVNNKILTREEVDKVLKDKKNTSEKVIAIIKMRDDVKYERLVDVLSLVKENDISVSLKNIVEE